MIGDAMSIDRQTKMMTPVLPRAACPSIHGHYTEKAGNPHGSHNFALNRLPLANLDIQVLSYSTTWLGGIEENVCLCRPVST